ncbi:aspartate dehydrogenase [Acrasis kona]|uniref:Aspartate dehydrogenase domain-containing protein n=1 Tax=Acrasis kona TaxID=1008807 RepID=A0AAW2YWL0_9EUKA
MNVKRELQNTSTLNFCKSLLVDGVMSDKVKVGIVGFGNLGQFLVDQILTNKQVSNRFEICFIWNRTSDKITTYFKENPSFKTEWILEDLSKACTQFPSVQMIVEVCHPSIIEQYGVQFLSHCDLFVGSPTAFANNKVEKDLRDLCNQCLHGCYIPSGALWGAQDIEKMATLNSLKELTITMKKHPSSLKLEPPLSEKLVNFEQWDDDKEYVIYEGPVRELCPLAPNNVNTMACAALAGHNLGFDKVKARLVADKRLEAHVIDIDVVGPGGDSCFRVVTQRINPAKAGAVTGNATYNSFLSSLLQAYGRGGGFHFC